MSWYDEHAAQLSQMNARHQFVLAFILPHLQQGMTILDLGCGAGITTEAMRLAGCDVIGVDSCESLIGGKQGYVVDDICTVELGRKFDAICAVDCIEHVTDLDGFFDTIESHAADTCSLFINYPFPRYLDHIRATKPELLQPVDNSIEFHDIAARAHDVGFEIGAAATYGLDIPNFQYTLALFVKGDFYKGA